MAARSTSHPPACQLQCSFLHCLRQVGSSRNLSQEGSRERSDPGAASAQLWARRVLAAKSDSAEQCVKNIYLSAFSRPPTTSELAEALAFLDEQGASLGIPTAERRTHEKIWADFCHVMLNVKGFAFVH